MNIKILGSAVVIISCSSVGFRIAANHRKEERYLHDLDIILDFMISELQFRHTPLPTLCRQASKTDGNVLAPLFSRLSDEMELQIRADPDLCMAAVLANLKSIPPITRKQLELLGKTMGRFDMDGQIKGINLTQKECQQYLSVLRNNRDSRLQGYQTLAICAGAALAILFV